MNRKDSMDIVWLVTISAALVTVVRYSAAFMASDMGTISGTLSEWVTILMAFTGLGMGILDVFGGAYLFNGWRKTMPRTGQKWSFRFKTLTFFVFGLIFCGMIILVPFTVSRISHVSVAEVLGDGYGKWIWSTMVNVVPYFLVGGVFSGNKIIMDMAEESSGKVSEGSGKVSGKGEKVSEKVTESLPKDWRKLRPTLTTDQVRIFANLSPAQVKELASRYEVTEKTVWNWRAYARKEIG